MINHKNILMCDKEVIEPYNLNINPVSYNVR